MEKILLDYQEYERLKQIEKEFNTAKLRHQSPEKAKSIENEPKIEDSQVGGGQIPTGLLQKEALIQENGPSEQTLLVSPSAPVIFTSKQSPSKDSVKVTNDVQPAKKKVKKTSNPSDLAVQKWWYLD